MGLNIPKQFLPLGGFPVIMHTINRFASLVDTIVVTLPEQYFDYWKELSHKYSFIIPHVVVGGGDTRFFSVKNALEHIPDNGFVAIHDAVRPFVKPDLIKRCFEQAKINGNAVAAIPVKDSLRIISNSTTKSIDRSKYLIVQTPQVFSCEIIKKAYKQAINTDFTDDASVVEASGYEINIVNGDEMNFKITTQNDLAWGEFLINCK